MKGTTLSSRAGVTLNGRWKIPSVGTIGNICNDDLDDADCNDGTGRYLSTNGNRDAGSVVVEEDYDHLHKSGQLWQRLPNVDSGFFTLKNMDSGLFLTMKTANALTIGNV